MTIGPSFNTKQLAITKLEGYKKRFSSFEKAINASVEEINATGHSLFNFVEESTRDLVLHPDNYEGAEKPKMSKLKECIRKIRGVAKESIRFGEKIKNLDVSSKIQELMGQINKSGLKVKRTRRKLNHFCSTVIKSLQSRYRGFLNQLDERDENVLRILRSQIETIQEGWLFLAKMSRPQYFVPQVKSHYARLDAAIEGIDTYIANNKPRELIDSLTTDIESWLAYSQSEQAN